MREGRPYCSQSLESTPGKDAEEPAGASKKKFRSSIQLGYSLLLEGDTPPVLIRHNTSEQVLEGVYRYCMPGLRWKEL